MRWILVCCIGVSACRMLESGLDAGSSRGDSYAEAPATMNDGPVAQESREEFSGEPGDPLVLGCADGTREGFLRHNLWPHIAACSGGFSQSGVVGQEAQIPKCKRMTGNSWEDNPKGEGCGAADLCAVGWHLCLNGQDLSDHSPTGDCEGCVVEGDPRFFLVGVGASPQGICFADPAATNDLHGCGSRGQPETVGCSPLFRRMTFTDCKASGIWRCGTEDDYLNEAAVVQKIGPEHGGVLCCKD